MIECRGEPYMIHCQFEKNRLPLDRSSWQTYYPYDMQLVSQSVTRREIALLTDGERYKRRITIICECFSDQPVCAHLARPE